VAIAGCQWSQVAPNRSEPFASWPLERVPLKARAVFHM